MFPSKFFGRDIQFQARLSSWTTRQEDTDACDHLLILLESVRAGFEPRLPVLRDPLEDPMSRIILKLQGPFLRAFAVGWVPLRAHEEIRGPPAKASRVAFSSV